MKSSAGKGSTPRKVNKYKYDTNYDLIRWRSRPVTQKIKKSNVTNH